MKRPKKSKKRSKDPLGGRPGRGRVSAPKGRPAVLADPVPHPALFIPRMYELMYQALGPQHWWPGDTPFEVMVGAILTQNCNWKNVEKAIANLKRLNLLSPEALLETDSGKVGEAIRPAGYFNVKTGRLKNFLRAYRDQGWGDGERLRKQGTLALRGKLLEVNGLGPETADSILLYAWGRAVFVIDAYTRRILKRHFMIGGKERYDEIQDLFEAHLAEKPTVFNEYHALIVMIGKDYCKPRAKCAGCPLACLAHDEKL